MVGDQILTTIKGTATAHGVTQPVAEGADAGAGQVELGGVDPAGVVRHFAKVPAFAIDIDGRVDSVEARSHLEHILLHVVTHQVKAETAHPILRGPDLQRVEHELFHHRMLGGGVGATGARLHATVEVEAVIVTGHDLVEH